CLIYCLTVLVKIILLSRLEMGVKKSVKPLAAVAELERKNIPVVNKLILIKLLLDNNLKGILRLNCGKRDIPLKDLNHLADQLSALAHSDEGIPQVVGNRAGKLFNDRIKLPFF